MKRIITLLALVGMCHLVASAQKKYEMVIEKTDGTETVINVEDIVRTYFRERTDGPGEESNFLVGHWQECNAAGTLRNDATGTEVMHMNILSNDKGEWWSVTKGTKDPHWFSFDYTYSFSGTTGEVTQTITASSNPLEVGTSFTAQVTYSNGILHSGSVYYKKVGGPIDSGIGGGNANAYTSCPDANHPHMIDLGLPSDTKWACCNVGASAPEGYGNYYAWGETNPKSVYDWDTYQYGSSSTNVVNIGSDIAGTQYDAATANWGTPWRMPSSAQIEELLKNCTSTWTTQYGVKGRKFTGLNGGTIFLPAAGVHWGDDLKYPSYWGDYWSSTLIESDPVHAYYLGFGSANSGSIRQMGRCDGLSVRPVC